MTLRHFIVIACFLLTTSMSIFWLKMNHTMVINEQQSLLSEIASSEAGIIERQLSVSLSTTYLLAIEIQQNNGEFTNFDSYAEAIISSIGGVSNLQLAPNGIIKNIYPLQGNEKALGHNILRDDLRRSEAKMAIKQRKLTLAGPFELIQGGIAVIGRNPVFIKVQGKDTFWGFASALIFLDKLLATTQLEQLENKGYRYKLSRVHPESKSVEVFARSKKDLGPFPRSTKIEVPNANWTLTISRPKSTLWSDSYSIRISISILLGVLIACLVSYMLRQPELLQRTVRKKTAELERLAFYDPLTGLANRRLLSKTLQQSLSTSDEKNKVSLLYLDLDDFKRINDSIGHSSGDEFLVEIALRLNRIVKKGDLVSRLGGDEFAIILYDIQSINEVKKVAERLINAVKKPVFLHKRRFVISTSIGITLTPKDGQDVQSLLRNADMAMYAAKAAGKNGFSFFNEQLHQQAMEKHRIESELSKASKRGELILHYQPLVDLTTGNVRSFEALIRWQHPTEGLITPDRFIEIAEESGLIVEIGYWVIREACQMIRQSKVEYQLTIAVNLSPKQFLDPSLLDNIQSILNEFDIDPSCLEIEITESSLMTNVTDVVDILEQLRIIGIKVAIDDFGTGYSSLAQLKQLPVDKLKIDRSFISSLELSQSDQEIVRAIIVMAHTLQIEVVAEGIETQQQLDILKSKKCNIGQGYLFSRPVPFDQVLKHR